MALKAFYSEHSPWPREQACGNWLRADYHPENSQVRCCHGNNGAAPIWPCPFPTDSRSKCRRTLCPCWAVASWFFMYVLVQLSWFKRVREEVWPSLTPRPSNMCNLWLSKSPQTATFSYYELSIINFKFFLMHLYHLETWSWFKSTSYLRPDSEDSNNWSSKKAEDQAYVLVYCRWTKSTVPQRGKYVYTSLSCLIPVPLSLIHFLRKRFFEVALVIHSSLFSTSIFYSYNLLWKYSFIRTGTWNT